MRNSSLSPSLVFIAVASAHSTAQHQLQPVAALSGEPALELALRKLDTVGNFMMTTAHPGRREQRDAGVLLARQGIPHVAGHGDARRRRAERDRPGAVRGARGAAHRGAAGGASLRRRRAVLHARDRFRLLVQRRRDAREVGPPGDPRRLRAHDPHDPARRDRRLRVRRRRRRPASPGLVATDARSVSRGGGSGEVPRADQGRPAAVAGEEVLLHGRLRRASGAPGAQAAAAAAAARTALSKRRRI